MRLSKSVGLLLLIALHPMVLTAADPPAETLIARGDRNFSPYEFINAHGRPDGFNIDLIKAIADRMKMKMEIGLDDWETVREDLAQGKIDIVTGMIRSPDRERQFDFSIAHAGIFYCLFVREGSAIQTIEHARGMEILVRARDYSEDWLLARNVTDRLFPVASPQEALRLLASGRHDCAILERLSTLELIQDLGIDTIVMAGSPLMCAPYAFAVQKGNDRLLAKLNEGIHLMHRNGGYDDLYRKWFSVADAHSRRMAVFRFGALVLAVVVALALAVLIWNIVLKRMVRRKTAALVQSNRRFHELCDLLPQTVFETDAKGYITFLNRSGFEMLGLSEETSLTGMHISNFLPGACDLDRWAQSDDRSGKTCEVSSPHIDPFPALLYATPVIQAQRYAGVRGLLVDITFQKELEKQVIESQKLEALGRLAGGVAHDFNNIVTGISAYAQMIAKQPCHGEHVADCVAKILTGCDRATDLVRHFLVTAGRRQPEKQPVRLGQLVNEIFKLLQPTYGMNIAFENVIDREDDAVWAEPALVFQVLMNLCVNSAQAMADNGGVLTVGLHDDTPQDREAEQAPKQRVLYVTDTGPGIDPELKDRIFEPFFTTRKQDRGTGIGLFVVSQALAEMEGAIRVESQLGRGATFVVSLPASGSGV